MLFSIVIPLYNKSYSIKRCISSVLAQNYKKYEIIIVNDGSTDDSLAIIKNTYKNEVACGLIKIIDQTNQGVSVARNNGIKASKSDYVCLLDADDEWYSDFLVNINELIKCFPSAALYCLQHEVNIYSNTKKSRNLYRNGYFGLVDNFFKRSLLGSVANSSKVCIRKDILKEMGFFPEGQKSGEDLFIWMQIALHYPVAFYNKVSSRINVGVDISREGRSVSVPYPFVYFSYRNNKQKLSIWAEIYLYKIFIMHIASSLRELNYQGFKLRVESGKKIFPVTAFIFKFLEFPLKVINHNR